MEVSCFLFVLLSLLSLSVRLTGGEAARISGTGMGRSRAMIPAYYAVLKNHLSNSNNQGSSGSNNQGNSGNMRNSGNWANPNIAKVINGIPAYPNHNYAPETVTNSHAILDQQDLEYYDEPDNDNLNSNSSATTPIMYGDDGMGMVY